MDKPADTSVVATTALAEPVKRRGRPPALARRPMVSLRMDADLLEKLRALGPGWQTRVNAVLRSEVDRGGFSTKEAKASA